MTRTCKGCGDFGTEACLPCQDENRENTMSTGRELVYHYSPGSWLEWRDTGRRVENVHIESGHVYWLYTVTGGVGFRDFGLMSYNVARLYMTWTIGIGVHWWDALKFFWRTL